MGQGADICYSVSGEKLPNRIVSVALRGLLEDNHTGFGSYSMFHIKLPLRAALLSMIINHGVQHWPWEVPGQVSTRCIAGVQSQCFKGWMPEQGTRQMQFATKLQIFGHNNKWIQKRKIPPVLKNLWSQFFSVLQDEGTLYPLYTGRNDYQECKARENEALKKRLCQENISEWASRILFQLQKRLRKCPCFIFWSPVRQSM